MGNSLGDFKIGRSSSSNIRNIKWTKKNPGYANKSKNKKKTARKTSPLNIIYTSKPKKIKSHVEKVFRIKVINDNEKLNKNKDPDKRFQTSSASNCLISQGFKRKAR